MDISGLVQYTDSRSNHSASTGSVARGGLMPTQMAMAAEQQPYAQDHMVGYSPYANPYGYQEQFSPTQQHHQPQHHQQLQPQHGMGVTEQTAGAYSTAGYSQPQHQTSPPMHHPVPVSLPSHGPPLMRGMPVQQQHIQHQHQQQQSVPRDAAQLGRSRSSMRIGSESTPQNSAYGYPTPQQQHQQLHQQMTQVQQQHHQQQMPRQQQYSQQHQTPQQQQLQQRLPQQHQPHHSFQQPQQHHTSPRLQGQHHYRPIPEPPSSQSPQSHPPPPPQSYDHRPQSIPSPPLTDTPRTITKITSPHPEVDFRTDVDNLMKAIQSKIPSGSPPLKTPSPSYTHVKPELSHHHHHHHPGASVPPPPHNPYVTYYPNPLSPGSDTSIAGSGRDEITAAAEKKQRQKKKYECEVQGCGKAFSQKTHLEIHTRAHSGDKPFLCSAEGCGQRFSQLGNLKTHERRHTGEKPYKCDQCGKAFAQRGNVRAHKIVHQGQKPFQCKLEDCNKQFTQLGNLKSHQNKFHSSAIRDLTTRFANIRSTDDIPPEELSLFEYFATLYRNSNKGIKGRGKDRKIATKKPDKPEGGSARAWSLHGPQSPEQGGGMQGVQATGMEGYGGELPPMRRGVMGGQVYKQEHRRY